MRHLLALALFLGGCPNSGLDSAGDSSGDSGADTCDSVQDRGTALRSANQGCTAAVGCEIVSNYEIAGENNCLGAFQCADAYPTGADRTQLAADAVALSDEARACGTCMDDVACEDPTKVVAVCNETTGLCEVGG
ncbi:MAG: hypothetical protein Q8P41_15355 [Pseudomonadota bacterium]|nr:hypothetical protein [Pseudomonadota bacterium]